MFLAVKGAKTAPEQARTMSVSNAVGPMRQSPPPAMANSTRAVATALPPDLTGRQKAAVIVRLLVAEGAPLALTSMTDVMQADLTEQISLMRRIDRATLRRVCEEFLGELEGAGLSFPGGIERALQIMDGHISPNAASRLRRMVGQNPDADPWERIAGLDSDMLAKVLDEESVEVGAVMLSKLPVSKAAELLGRLPGERARRIAYAVSLTGAVLPDTVRRIGQSLAGQLDAQPPRAFDADPVERIGAILNFSAAGIREDVLQGLEETDALFAEEVRKAIFTFSNIPTRIDARDVPKIIRGVPQGVLVTALAGATGSNAPSAEFILANMSQRMAATLREEIAGLGKVRDKAGEEAMAAIILAIREREAAGEIFLIAMDE